MINHYLEALDLFVQGQTCRHEITIQSAFPFDKNPNQANTVSVPGDWRIYCIK